MVGGREYIEESSKPDLYRIQRARFDEGRHPTLSPGNLQPDTVRKFGRRED